MALKRLLTTTALVLSTALLVSCGGGGSSNSTGGGGSAVVPPPPPPPPPPTVFGDIIPPVVSFSPSTLTVASGDTGSASPSATDNIGVTSGPTVTCTKGGSFSNGTFTAPQSRCFDVTSVCTATARDAAGNTGSATLTVTTPKRSLPVGDRKISGRLTFDLVPLNTSTNGLNYSAISQEPARGITIEALDASNALLSCGVTDANGNYEVSVNSNTDVRIRARAEMMQTTGPKWDVSVIDNTSSNALYALNGSLASSGTVDSTRNLNAASGWGGSSYTGTRAAAPFAILNPIYDALQQISVIDPDVVFPPNEFGWSVNNRPANGNVANGEISTSSYVGNGRVNILGAADNDTDEYDDHVVIHEWGHYFEDQLSRSDSLGGPHSGSDRLDPRVALGEGFGNALSGMITDDPFYRDSSGSQQANGFSIDVESNSASPEGWFNEFSVQSILYDLYDSADEGADTITLGLGPIYNVLTDPDYTGQSLFTTIFSFLDEVRSAEPGNVTAINALAAAQSIDGTGKDGAGESNNGSTANSLPVYKTASVNGAAVQVCSAGTNSPATNPVLFNKLRNRNYVRFTITNAGTHTVSMTRTSGSTSRDPDFIIYRDGVPVLRAESAPGEREAVTVSLTAGDYVVDAYDFFNLGQGGSGTPGNACYDFTITQ
ncbi:DUF5011/hyalin repeat domain-containing protein [Hellea balneolensis]|uniref:hypothetical protein n=1 Tax=Hellea balneolensis TaxID=287478 RepID=UPI00040BD6B2|nr:hypothetical protein [Hellea balneolensis]